jgi:FdhE protein
VIDRAVGRLEALAGADPAVAPVARLRAEALRDASDRAWEAGLPELDRARAEGGRPLLHGRTFRADPERVRRLLARLAAVAGRSAGPEMAALGRVVERGLLDALAVLEASVVQDTARIETLAESADVEFAPLATLGQLATLPVLLACGRRAAPLLDGIDWDAGHCPVCAAWPTLAELRGLERKLWLRCGRCGGDWSSSQSRCPFCASLSERERVYLAPEQDRESRQAVVCTRCRSYLKWVTTIGPIPPAEIGLEDLRTLELDVVAIEQGYGRPEAPGWPLEVAIEPARRRALWGAWRG